MRVHSSRTNYERSEIRLPTTAEEPRVHLRRGAHARARHWGEHGDFQLRERDPVAAPAIQRPGAAGDDLRESSGQRLAQERGWRSVARGMAETVLRL